MEKKWFVAHTYSGHEQKAKRYLENAIATQGLEDTMGRVLVPTETVVERKHGKRSTTVKKFAGGDKLRRRIGQTRAVEAR